MPIRYSQSLVAVLALIATPAFAQDTAAPETDAATEGAAQLQQAGDELKKKVQDAADSAEAAADDAANAIKDATSETTDAAEADTATDAESSGQAAPDAEADAASTTESDSETPPADSEATPSDSTETSDQGEAETEAATTDENQEDATTEEAGTATDDATPSEQAAEDSDGEPRIGAYYAESTHSDWTIRCVRTESGIDPCELYQLLNDSDGNSVAEMTLIPLNNAEVAAGATMVVPLETDLTKGLSLAIDSGKANGYPFSFCAQVGCVSRMGFTSGELAALKGGAKAKVSLLPFGADPENPVELEMSLSGFTAAYDKLTKLAEEAQAAAAEQGSEEAQPAE